MLITGLMTSQVGVIDCVTEDSDLLVVDGLTYTNNPNDYLTGDPLVLNVFYWQVRGPNGDYGSATFTENKVLENVAYLNRYYNQYNIFFKYRGYDGFDTPNDLPLFEEIYNEELEKWECVDTGQLDPNGYGHIDRCQHGDFIDWVSNEGYIKQDAINIYVPYGSGFGGAAAGARIILKIDKMKDDAAIHEIAHTFGLSHTRSKMGVNISFGSERATRDPNGIDYYNANFTADKLVETAAHDVFYDRVCGNTSDPDCYPNVDSSNCEVSEFSQEVDYEGHLTKPHITHGDIINVMSTAYLCTELYFFPAQVNKMRNAIETKQYLINVSTVVPSLYEPYAGVYNTPGTIAEYPPAKFQPGFDYQFLNCYPDGGYPQPSDYSNTSFSYLEGGLWWYGFSKDISIDYYNTIIHKDRYTIRIEQLEQQPRKCWNTGQGAIAGSVIKFNDNVLNANVTITPQDSTAINNPELLDNLQPGLYNIIKTYNSGENQENVILKVNN